MKTLFKYIALLAAAGIIIPLYQYAGAVKTAPVISTSKANLVDNPVKHDGGYHYSAMHDAAAKILPVLNLFN